MSSAASLLLQGTCCVADLGIDHEIGAKALGVGELAVIDVDGANEQSHGLRILDRQMPEATGATDQRLTLRFRTLEFIAGVEELEGSAWCCEHGQEARNRTTTFRMPKPFISRSPCEWSFRIRECISVTAVPDSALSGQSAGLSTS
jgi:hypothetical protein